MCKRSIRETDFIRRQGWCGLEQLRQQHIGAQKHHRLGEDSFSWNHRPWKMRSSLWLAFLWQCKSCREKWPFPHRSHHCLTCSSTCRKLVCKHVLSWPPRYSIHIVFLVCSINGRNTADNNDFQEFPPFFAKPAASSENIWHKKTDMTVFHIGNISEIPKMRCWIPEHLTAELGFPQVLKIHL